MSVFPRSTIYGHFEVACHLVGFRWHRFVACEGYIQDVCLAVAIVIAHAATETSCAEG